MNTVHTVVHPAASLGRGHLGVWRDDASGPRFRTIFGFMAVMRDDPLGFLMACARRYGDRLLPVHIPPFRSFIATHPDDVKHILQEHHRNYWKGTAIAKLKRIAGEGLVFSDGDLWKRQRQLVQPAFHRERVAAMADMMTARTGAMLERWQDQATNGRGFDVAEEMSNLTLEIVAQALFGTELTDDTTAFKEAVTNGLVYANHLMNSFFPLPLFIPTRANRRGRRAIATLDQIVRKLIEARRSDAVDRGDLLTMLLAARDATTGAAMEPKQLRDECVTFLVAGHETTAVALSWTWHLLASHPEVEQRLHTEINEILDGRTPTFKDLNDLVYTRMVFEEAMRLYPPAWATSREAYADDEFGGQCVSARSIVIISPYVTHRNPTYWENPEIFDPERFTPERSAGRPEWAYYPFGGGPRGCIGRQFAMMEGQLVLAMVAQRFRLCSVPGHRVEPHPIFTLRPRYGIAMTVHPRG